MVERGGLENRCARKRTEGSNPSPSASYITRKLAVTRTFSLGCANAAKSTMGLCYIRLGQNAPR